MREADDRYGSRPVDAWPCTAALRVGLGIAVALERNYCSDVKLLRPSQVWRVGLQNTAIVSFAHVHIQMCSGSESGSYLRLIDSCITQLKAQGTFRTRDESKEEG